MSEICSDKDCKKQIDAEFLRLRNCLGKKASWVMVGVVVVCIGILAPLCYKAYSNSQEKQDTAIERHAEKIQNHEVLSRVMENKLENIKIQLNEMKIIQEKSFNAIMRKLDNLEEKGGDMR